MEKVRLSRNLVGKQTALQFLKEKISYLLSRNSVYCNKLLNPCLLTYC